jgi:hypothetical protein
MIIQDELQPVKLVMSRDYIYYSNTNTVKMDGGCIPIVDGWVYPPKNHHPLIGFPPIPGHPITRRLYGKKNI